MADNRTVKRSIKTLQKITTWQLAIILLLMLFVSATFLRLNNIGMAQRREAVKAADKQGDSTNLQNRVLDLQHYVAAHMNTDGNAVYLEQQYARDKAQILQKAAQSNTATDVINKKSTISASHNFQATLRVTYNVLRANMLNTPRYRPY